MSTAGNLSVRTDRLPAAVYIGRKWIYLQKDTHGVLCL